VNNARQRRVEVTGVWCRECDGDINWRSFDASDENEWEWGHSDENQQAPGDALLEKEKDVRSERWLMGRADAIP
jgi:hypothetical protein